MALKNKKMCINILLLNVGNILNFIYARQSIALVIDKVFFIVECTLDNYEYI